jgi:hypothetical protein
MTTSNATERSFAWISEYQTWREQQWPPKQPQRPVMFHSNFNPTCDRVSATVRPSILCPKCKPIRAWVRSNWRRSGRAFLGLPEFRHHATGIKLHEQCMRGCHLCTLLLHSKVEKSSWKIASEGSQRSFLAETELMKLCMAEDARVKITPPSTDGQETALLMMTISLRMSQRSTIDPLGYIESDPIEISFLPSRTRSQWKRVPVLHPKDYYLVETLSASSDVSTASNSNLLSTSRWLEQCTTTHRNCKSALNSSSAIPSRLLDVGDAHRTHSVNLVLTNGSFSGVKYVALSYCWGRSPGYKLALSTMKTLQSRVPI